MRTVPFARFKTKPGSNASLGAIGPQSLAVRAVGYLAISRAQSTADRDTDNAGTLPGPLLLTRRGQLSRARRR